MPNNSALELALAKVEKSFRKRIIETYLELKQRLHKALYSREFDASGLSSGKFCETVFRFIEFELTKNYTPFTKHIPNFAKAVVQLEQIPQTSGHESLRIIIPRALLFIYTLRNKRGIGHVGGDVEANQVDATTIAKNADWIIIELIRIYHNLSFEDAQGIVDSINSKSIPDIWEINGRKRILKKGLDFASKVLLIVYSDVQNAVAVEDVFHWVEYSNINVFKQNVLSKLHAEALIDFDRELDYIHLSPLGIKFVEENVLK